GPVCLCDCACVCPETAHRSVQWRFASQVHVGLAFIQPPRYFLSPTAPPLRGLEDDQPGVFLAVRKGRLADCAKQPPIWPHPSEQVLVPQLVLLPHLELSAVVRNLRLHVLVPDQAVIGTRHQLRLADGVQQGDVDYTAVLDVYDFKRPRRHLLDNDRLRLETRRELKRIVADHSMRRRGRGQRQRNGCDDFLHGRAACSVSRRRSRILRPTRALKLSRSRPIKRSFSQFIYFTSQLLKHFGTLRKSLCRQGGFSLTT